eukprot:m.149548 g.149548  ORF g.149548 m.149548 type:complete len:83 (+) comp15016_c0_seq7:126-374(+)
MSILKIESLLRFRFISDCFDDLVTNSAIHYIHSRIEHGTTGASTTVKRKFSKGCTAAKTRRCQVAALLESSVFQCSLSRNIH